MSETPERLALRKTYMSHAVTSGPLMEHPDYVHYVRADRIEELEAKLAKAMEALENIRDVAKISEGTQWYAMIADKALKGQDDD